jgi:tetratricopeptide (TPR) repeat protein
MQSKPSTPGSKRNEKKPKILQPADKPVPRTAQDYKRHLLAGFALCVLTLLAYSNSFQSGFVLDNQGLLLDPRIREATSENFALIFRHTYWWPNGEAGLYRPFTTLSYLFNYAIMGDRDQIAGYHSINLVLHLGNVLLAYALALRLVRRFWPSVFVAAVWAVHPLLTESVTNIVGRADLLAAMAVLTGFLMYLKSAEAGSTLARVSWLAGLAAVTAVGVFSKESAVAILPLIVLYELLCWRKRPQHRALTFGCIATLVPIAVMLYQRSAVLAASPPAEFPFTDNPITGADWWTGRITAVKVMARYLWLTIWPAKLSCDYSYNQIPLAGRAAGDWLAYGTVLAVAILVVLLYRWNRICCFLAGFAFLNFFPASNLVFTIGTIMADRLFYLPSLGLLACMTLAIYAVAGERRMAFLPPLILSLIAGAFAIRTWVRNADWQTNLTLATADVRVSPNSFKLHRLLATSLFDSDSAHANIDRVIEEQEKSLAILDPIPAVRSGPDPYRQAGYYYLVKGDQSRLPSPDQGKPAYEKALPLLLRSISIDNARRVNYLAGANRLPSGRSEGDPKAYLLLSLVYSRLGDLNQAYEAVNKARALDPLNPQVYRQLATVFAQQSREDDADIASLLDHAITSLQEGKWQDAADLAGRVMQIRPADYPAAYILNAMANLRLGNLDRAEKSAREAMRFDGGRPNPRNNYVLGMILAQKRDFKASAELLNTYLTAAPDAPDAETVRRQLSEIERMAQNQSTGR